MQLLHWYSKVVHGNTWPSELITHSWLILPACLWVEVWWLTRSDLVTSQTNTLLLWQYHFVIKIFQTNYNLDFMWKIFQIKKNNQKEHLSLFHRGSNTVLNATNFLQKRGVGINILTPSIWKLIMLVINVGNNWPN